MTKNNIKIYILYLTIFFVAILSLNYFLGVFRKSVPLSLNQNGHIEIEIFEGVSSEPFSFDAWFQTGESLATVLKRSLLEKGVNFDFYDYGGSMGEFVESIEGYSNQKDVWWQYWINDKYAKVGISNYFPSEGDKIVFKLVEYQNSYEQ